jgi:hypothetical protein
VAIPRSTVSTWRRRGSRPVVTIEPIEQDRQQLLDTIAKLDRRVRILAAVVRVLPAMLRASGFTLAGERLPEGSAKAGIINSAVDATLLSACLERVLAQVDVAYSNSMIEAFWRSLKHQWLYLNSLDSIERFRALVKSFVEEHNTQMPHSAFAGQTPDEMYFGTAVDLPAQLAAARSKARAECLAANRAMTCSECSGRQASLPESPIPP